MQSKLNRRTFAQSKLVRRTGVQSNLVPRTFVQPSRCYGSHRSMAYPVVRLLGSLSGKSLHARSLPEDEGRPDRPSKPNITLAEADEADRNGSHEWGRRCRCGQGPDSPQDHQGGIRDLGEERKYRAGPPLVGRIDGGPLPFLKRLSKAGAGARVRSGWPCETCG